MLTVKGSGILRLGDKEIPFQNKVNEGFVMAAQHFIDIQRLAGANYVGLGLRDCQAVTFMLLSNPADPSMKAVYNRLGFININNFSVIAVSPRKTTIRGAGVIHTAGTVRSAGFNPLCEETPPAGNSPWFNVPIRQVELRVEGLASVPYADNWVYVPAAEALFWYSNTSTEIWKLPFDRETGTFGTPIMVTNAFTRTGIDSYDYPTTDGSHRIFRYANSTVSSIVVFDFLTETVTTVPLSANIPALQDYWRAWDAHKELWCASYTSGTTITFVDIETGQVTTQTKDSHWPENPRIIYEKYKIDGTYIRQPYGGVELGRPGVGSSWFDMEGSDSIPKRYRFPDENGWQMIGSFNSTTTPGVFTIRFLREPDTSMTIINITPTPVEVDTPFSVDYTFEVTDTR